jgi:hypothetical protein
MVEMERLRWPLIACETIDQTYAVAGIDELLAEVAAAQVGSNG